MSDCELEVALVMSGSLLAQLCCDGDVYGGDACGVCGVYEKATISLGRALVPQAQ